jgi:hypothetical protein
MLFSLNEAHLQSDITVVSTMVSLPLPLVLRVLLLRLFAVVSLS